MGRRGGKAASRSNRRRAQRAATRGPQPSIPFLPPSVSPPVSAPAAAKPSPVSATGSRLSERAAAEYHYVARDLRNTGILVLVMAGLLAAATIAFAALGIGPG